ncbi:MAG: YciI family protein [Chloroflexota bacterium]|nr:YciI family protein [Chloroflexota bacterium]
MTRYLLSVHSGNGTAPEKMTDEEMRRGYEQVAKLEAEMTAARALVFSGRLDAPDRARVARPAKGHVRWTDGPYAETKEQLGGFYIIDAPDIDAALGWASKVSLAINTPIEVRPFFDTR